MNYATSKSYNYDEKRSHRKKGSFFKQICVSIIINFGFIFKSNSKPRFIPKVSILLAVQISSELNLRCSI
ncbi:hypothetical protein WA026_008034 [Henosepilachna vigintioctopunctata]|uniref:Uncharacterized protein n=1 Tax=Henosepilachna vigintioctopunctata TaxID=420089 RepID=A0AAW1TIG5_9CUCU